jgi:hypothetical protein
LSSDDRLDAAMFAFSAEMKKQLKVGERERSALTQRFREEVMKLQMQHSSISDYIQFSVEVDGYRVVVDTN